MIRLIKPGTIFHLTKNASIIFKNRVEAIGTINLSIFPVLNKIQNLKIIFLKYFSNSWRTNVWK